MPASPYSIKFQLAVHACHSRVPACRLSSMTMWQGGAAEDLSLAAVQTPTTAFQQQFQTTQCLTAFLADMQAVHLPACLSYSV